jgi:YgiT-type zinc finger domain-containing protein
MACLYCSGKLKRDKINYTVNRHGYHLIIDDLPAWVCDQCGEPLLDVVTVEAIQTMLQTLDQQVHKVATVEPAG